MKKINFKTIFVLILLTVGLAFGADLDFDADNDSKIDTIYLDFSHDVTGAVECNGAGACEQAEYEDLSNYNALDPDYLAGDADDDDLLDPEAIDTTELAVTMSVDDLITLSGRSAGSQHLGTFTGTTIDDNLTIKAAFQDLETTIEGLGGGHDPVTLSTGLNSALLNLSSQELQLDSQAANLVFSGPSSGGSAAPSFRSLVAADIPDISATYETQLVNEAGLYAALSDVSDFHQPGDTLRTGSGTSLPGTCTIGDIYVDTDADTDGDVYFCRDTNTWKSIDDDGAGGSDVLAKVSSNETDADYLVNQIAGGDVSINVAESGSGDETLQITVDVTPGTAQPTLHIADDAVRVKFKAADFDETADGLALDYTNGQAAASGTKGFLTGTDWDTFNAKESETHASEHAVGGADTVFAADPGANALWTWDDTAGTGEWGQSADLAYDGSNWTVVDDSHAHVYSDIDATTSSNWAGRVSDETGSGLWVFGTSPTFTTDINTPVVHLTDENVSPSAIAGHFKYDNTIPGLIDGGLVWYDDDEIQLVVSVPMDNFGSGPTDDYVLCYDAINDEHYYCEASGVGGNTKFNLIADADADGTIQLLGHEQTITTTIDESGGVMWTLKHTDSDGLTNDTYLMELIHVNDGDAQAHFMRGLDNTSDELWSIAYDGTATFKAVNTSGSSTPGYTFNDTDNPGTDKEIAKFTANYLSGADGAEDGSFHLQMMIAGTERTYIEADADLETLTFGDSNTGEDLVLDFDTGTGDQITVSTNSNTQEIIFSNIIVDAYQLQSAVTTGTAPLTVASTTKVTNLNADEVDGVSITAGTENQLAKFNATGDLEGTSTLSSVTIGGFTANRALETDASGNLEVSAVTDTELQLLDGLTAVNFVQDASANPSTTSAGHIAVDTDDHFIEFYSNASKVVGGLYCETFTISEPDQQADDIVLKHFMTDSYPHGVTIKDIAISTSASATDTHVIEEWSNRAGAAQTTIESIALSATQYQEDDGTLSDADIAADAFIVLNKDDSTDDLAYMEVTITYWIDPGD